MLISLVTYIDRYGSLRIIVAIQFASKVEYKEIYLGQVRALTIQTYESLPRLYVQYVQRIDPIKSTKYVQHVQFPRGTEPTEYPVHWC